MKKNMIFRRLQGELQVFYIVGPKLQSENIQMTIIYACGALHSVRCQGGMYYLTFQIKCVCQAQPEVCALSQKCRQFENLQDVLIS
jgi:hypothetical protein